MTTLREKLLENPSARYQPVSFMLGVGLSSATLDGKPIFTWFDVYRMIRDPQVRLVERMWRAPFRLATWKVRAEDPRVKRFVDATLRRYWWRSLPFQLKNYFRWGYAPGAAEFHPRNGRIRLSQVKAIEPADVSPRVWKKNNQFAGFTARGLQILAPHAQWFAGYREYSAYYDFPPIGGMFNPWLEKNSRDGGLDQRVLYARKNASRGDVIEFPNEMVNVGSPDLPQEVHAQDVARQAVNTLATGATLVISSERYPGPGGAPSSEPKWKLTAPQATAEGAGRFYLEYLPQLDREMNRGACIPDEVLEASRVGSGWSGRTVPLMQFFGGVDELTGLLIESADSWLRYAVAANYSPAAWYEVEPESMVEKLLADTGGDPGKAGEATQQATDPAAPWQPFAGERGGRGQKNARTGAVKYLSVGSPIPREIRRRVRQILNRRGRRRPVELSWTRYEGPRGGHGWKDEKGDVVYQAEAPRDEDTHDGTPKDVDRVADSKVTRIIKAVGKVPGRLVKKARDKVQNTYTKLEGRYGKGYARAIVAAGVAGLPVPIPGSSAIFAAPLLAVAELHRRLRGTPHPTDADPKVVRTGSRWFIGRVFGRVRQALHLSDARSLPDDDTLRRMLAYVMLGTQERFTAAGDPAGAEPYLRHLGDMADDPQRLRQVLSAVELGWSPYTGPRGGTGWKNDETGRIKYGGNRPGEKKERQQASAKRAEELTALIQSRQATPEHYAELVTHLPALTVEQLHNARARMGTTFGGSKKTRGQMIDVLTNHVNGLVEEERANPRPPAAPSAPAMRPDGTPVATAPDTVYKVPTKSLKLDPERFQYKLGTNKKGVTDQFKDTKVFNPALAGVLTVWRDPETGEDHVVNGHHRYELADRLDHPDLNVMYSHAPTAEAARAAGALANIAEGRGTAIDAAKFMRDTGLTPADAEAKGINLRENIARDANTLLHLSDANFSKLARGMIDLPAALAVARHVTDPDRQDKLFKKFQEREDEGKGTTPRHMEEMARMMAAVPSVTTTEPSLFGDITNEDDAFDERAELAAAARADLAREVNDFAAGASERRAEKLGEHGNVLNVEANKQLKEDADRAKNLYDLLAHRKGPISDALNAGAVELKKAKTKKEKDHARASTLEAVRSAIRAEFDRLGTKAPDGGGEGAGVGGGGPADPDGSPVQGGSGEEVAPPAAPPPPEDGSPTADPFAHATADHAPAITSIPPGELGWVAGHQVRNVGGGKFQVETQKAYRTGSPAEISSLINDSWRRASAERSPIEKALARADAFTEPDWFGGGKAAEDVARRKAAVPEGARGVSLEPQTRGRPGTVVRDPETEAAHLQLDDTPAHTAGNFEPLDSSHSWRTPEVEKPKPTAQDTGDLFAEPVPTPEPAFPIGRVDDNGKPELAARVREHLGRAADRLGGVRGLVPGVDPFRIDHFRIADRLEDTTPDAWGHYANGRLQINSAPPDVPGEFEVGGKGKDGREPHGPTRTAADVARHELGHLIESHLKQHRPDVWHRWLDALYAANDAAHGTHNLAERLGREAPRREDHPADPLKEWKVQFPGIARSVGSRAGDRAAEAFAESVSAFTHPEYGTTPKKTLPPQLHEFMTRLAGGGI
jgi:hypothetical protein